MTVGLDPATPPDDCMALVKVAVAADGVSAPAADVPALRDVVAQAGRDGIDLKIVEVASNPGMDTALRDVATVVGYDHPESTVLVLSTNYVGSYSGQFHRSKLEAAEDHAKTGDPVVSAQNFLNELTAPDLPWTGLTVALLVGVAAAAVGTRFLQRRSKRASELADAAE
ncbi:Rv1476 family membrane protein [[Mycobacterium] nativiensis]|uniref:Rv1476 family membrane protein n=1 Tax=[Mycobacterium] nativiensis TaxID=2855503 RepID=UPI0038B58740